MRYNSGRKTTGFSSPGAAGGADLHSAMTSTADRIQILGIIFMLALIPVSAAAEKSHEQMGDFYYKKKEYSAARIEYDRAIENESTDGLRAKLGLALLRERRFRQAVEGLQGGSFSVVYVRMFADLKLNFRSRFLNDQGILEESSASENQKDLGRLLAGTLYLEDGDFERARAHYERLQKGTENEAVRRAASETLTAMMRYEEIPHKSVWLGGALSALLPGAGQFYAHNYADGVSAFGFTTVLAGSAIYMNHLETRAHTGHGGSIVMGLLGLAFYAANITGGAASAARYNIFQERKFQQEIRDRYFHLDFVEQTSDVRFDTSF